jgi:hypothetical protein
VNEEGMHIDGNGPACNAMNAADGLAQLGISGAVNRNALVAAVEEVAEARHRVLVLAAQVKKLEQEKCELLVTLEEEKRNLQAMTAQVASLETQVLHRDRQLALIFDSTSWFLTKPVRLVGRLLRGELGVVKESLHRYIKNIFFRNSELRVGWILVGNESYGSARIQGFNVHRHLLARNVRSVVLKAPEQADHHLDFGARDYFRIGFGRYDVVVFQKVFDAAAIRLAQWLRRLGCRTVFVLCDLYRTDMVRVVDRVIVTSDFLAQFVRDEYGVEPVFIDDAIEVQRDACVVPTANQHPRAVWVGSKDNWSTIERLQLLIKRSGLGDTIEVVTVSDHPDALVQWSKERALAECLRADFAIIPTESSEWAMAKSSNRLSMFLALGLPVVAQAIPSYLDLAGRVGGVVFSSTDEEWVDSLREMCDPTHRSQVIGDAAQQVRELLDMSIVGERWMNTLLDVSGKNNESALATPSGYAGSTPL